MEKYLDLTKANTSEAYIGELLLVGAQLVMPIINLGLLPGHPLNLQSIEQVFVDRSYLLFPSFQSVSCENVAPGTLAHVLFAHDAQESGFVFYCGAYNIFYPQEVEFRLVADTGELVLLRDSQLSATLWVPIPTPRLPQNMSDSLVQPFLRAELWPLADCER
jgi:hypothetical protein